MVRSTYALLVALVILATMADRAAGDITVSGTTYTGDDSKPAGGVTVQASRAGGPFGDHPTSNKDDGSYSLPVYTNDKFIVVYTHPNSKYVQAYKPDSGEFDGSGKDQPNQNVYFYTHEALMKKLGNDGYKKHLKRLIEILPKNHPRVKEYKERLEKIP